MRLQSILLAGALGLGIATAVYVGYVENQSRSIENKSYSQIRLEPQSRGAYVEKLKKKQPLPYGVHDIVFITNSEYQKIFGSYPAHDTVMKTQNNLDSNNGIGKGGDSTIYILEQAFKSAITRKEEDLVNILYDHEAKHAKDFKDGVVLRNGKRVTIEDFVVGTQDGKPVYQRNALQALVELSAYSNQLMASAKRDVSKECRERTKEESLQMFAVFVLTGKTIKAETYAAIIQEYIAPWMVHQNIVGVMKNEQGEDQVAMLIDDKMIWLPEEIILPSELLKPQKP